MKGKILSTILAISLMLTILPMTIASAETTFTEAGLLSNMYGCEIISFDVDGDWEGGSDNGAGTEVIRNGKLELTATLGGAEGTTKQPASYKTEKIGLVDGGAIHVKFQPNGGNFAVQLYSGSNRNLRFYENSTSFQAAVDGDLNTASTITYSGKCAVGSTYDLIIKRNGKTDTLYLNKNNAGYEELGSYNHAGNVVDRVLLDHAYGSASATAYVDFVKAYYPGSATAENAVLPSYTLTKMVGFDTDGNLEGGSNINSTYPVKIKNGLMAISGGESSNWIGYKTDKFTLKNGGALQFRVKSGVQMWDIELYSGTSTSGGRQLRLNTTSSGTKFNVNNTTVSGYTVKPDKWYDIIIKKIANANDEIWIKAASETAYVKLSDYADNNDTAVQFMQIRHNYASTDATDSAYVDFVKSYNLYEQADPTVGMQVASQIDFTPDKNTRTVYTMGGMNDDEAVYFSYTAGNAEASFDICNLDRRARIRFGTSAAYFMNANNQFDSIELVTEPGKTYEIIVKDNGTGYDVYRRETGASVYSKIFTAPSKYFSSFQSAYLSANGGDGAVIRSVKLYNLAGCPKFSYDENNKLDVIVDAGESGMLIVATYDGNRFENAELIEVTNNGGKIENVSVTTDTGKSVKIFWWNTNMSPKCDAKVMTVKNFNY